jgi:hypothetical protein
MGGIHLNRVLASLYLYCYRLSILHRQRPAGQYLLLTTPFAALRASKREQPAKHRVPVEALPGTHVSTSLSLQPLTLCSKSVFDFNGTYT